jgi:ribosomal protein S1
MTQPNLPDPVESASSETSFGDILSEFEHSHQQGREAVEGTVVSVTPDAVFVDIGRKMDGVSIP